MVVVSGVPGACGVPAAPGRVADGDAVAVGTATTVTPVVGVALTPPIADVADGLTVAAVVVARSVPTVAWSSPGSASAVPGPPTPESGAIRTRLSTPAASARPPTANSTLRGRGLR